MLTQNITTMKVLLLLLMIFCTMITKAQTTLVLQPDSITGNDTFIFDYYPDSTYEYDHRLDITAWTEMGTPYISRALIGFDLSSIPVSATINSAYLSLYHNPTATLYNGVHSGANAFYIQRITSEWHEDTTAWNNQPTTTNVNEVLLPATVSGSQDFPNIDVTAMVNDMVNTPNSSYGFMIRLQFEVQYADLLIAPSNHADSSVHPKLVINYLATGVEEANISVKRLNINPNPFSDKITITTKTTEQLEASLYDVTSRRILNQTFTNSTSINTEQLAKGIYIYEVRNKNGVIKNGKVVKH